MDKETKLVSAILVAGLLIAGGVWLGAKGEKVEAPTVKVDNFKEMAKSNFMDSCVGGSATYGYCSCAFEKLYAKDGAEGLLKLGEEYSRTNVLPEGTIELINECFEKL